MELPDNVARFFRVDAVRHQEGLEGMRPGDTGILLLGSRCGPIGFDLDALLHEMCHLVEIDDRRVSLPGWGLRYPQVEIMGRDYPEPTTFSGVARELRVLAYQTNLRRALGLSPSVAETIHSLRHMADYYHIPSENPNAWCKARLLKLKRRQRYSYASFEREWWRKVELIRGAGQ